MSNHAKAPAVTTATSVPLLMITLLVITYLVVGAQHSLNRALSIAGTTRRDNP